MTVAEKVAEFLAAQGCTHAFGIVGGANSLLFGAIAKRMEIVCTAHEQAAAMAATYFYRISGRIAPVLVTAGAGCMNTLTGVMAAHMDGIPLLVISGNEKSAFIKNHGPRSVGFQGFVPREVVSTFTKKAMTVDNPLGAILALHGMYRVALEGRQGPTWLDIPQDIAAMEAA